MADVPTKFELAVRAKTFLHCDEIFPKIKNAIEQLELFDDVEVDDLKIEVPIGLVVSDDYHPADCPLPPPDEAERGVDQRKERSVTLYRLDHIEMPVGELNDMFRQFDQAHLQATPTASVDSVPDLTYRFSAYDTCIAPLTPTIKKKKKKKTPVPSPSEKTVEPDKPCSEEMIFEYETKQTEDLSQLKSNSQKSDEEGWKNDSEEESSKHNIAIIKAISCDDLNEGDFRLSNKNPLDIDSNDSCDRKGHHQYRARGYDRDRSFGDRRRNEKAFTYNRPYDGNNNRRFDQKPRSDHQSSDDFRSFRRDRDRSDRDRDRSDRDRDRSERSDDRDVSNRENRRPTVEYGSSRNSFNNDRDRRTDGDTNRDDHERRPSRRHNFYNDGGGGQRSSRSGMNFQRDHRREFRNDHCNRNFNDQYSNNADDTSNHQNNNNNHEKYRNRKRSELAHSGGSDGEPGWGKIN